MPKAYRRGYTVAILVAIENDYAVIWHIFSHAAKNMHTIKLSGSRNDAKAVYNFHESIINALRPTLKEGVKSILIASAPKTNYANDFLNHLRTHYSWLIQGASKAAFSIIEASAATPSALAELSKATAFKHLISETTGEETENLLEVLNKRLNQNNNLVFFSLEEAEKLILAPQMETKLKPEYLLLTNDYLQESRRKSRVQRLLQIAKNRQVKVRVISAESNAGKRITQLGGIVCLIKPE